MVNRPNLITFLLLNREVYFAQILSDNVSLQFPQGHPKFWRLFSLATQLHPVLLANEEAVIIAAQTRGLVSFLAVGEEVLSCLSEHNLKPSNWHPWKQCHRVLNSLVRANGLCPLSHVLHYATLNFGVSGMSFAERNVYIIGLQASEKAGVVITNEDLTAHDEVNFRDISLALLKKQLAVVELERLQALKKVNDSLILRVVDVVLRPVNLVVVELRVDAFFQAKQVLSLQVEVVLVDV